MKTLPDTRGRPHHDLTYRRTGPRAFADASSWSGVIADLQAAGVNAVAPANPLRGIPGDAAYLTSFGNQLGGPTILVGHSYGGALITQSGSDARDVVGLVFVAAFAPEGEEKLADINGALSRRPSLGNTTHPHVSGRRGQIGDDDPERGLMAKLIATYGMTLESMADQAAEDRVVVTFRPTRIRPQG